MNAIPSIGPGYLIDNERYVQCPLLPVRDFVRYCEERNISVSARQLERFEELGLFYPMARVEHTPIQVKIRYVDGGDSYEDFGILDEGEAWSGPLRGAYEGFWFHRDTVESFRTRNMLWVPREREFSPWATFRDEGGETRIESFYSVFQILDLWHIRERLARRVSLDGADEWGDDFLARCREAREHTIASLRETWRIGREVALVCQAIADRYFPETQSDRRSIRITQRSDYHDWDWDKHRSQWNAAKEMDQFGILPERIKHLADYTARHGSRIDPLQRWYGLVSFVSVEKKNLLKGDARLAQEFYAMEKMLRLFYQDATGEELPPPDESPTWKKDSYYGDGVTRDPRQYLEFLANEFHLNPRPRLILVVEGDGENALFPRLAEKLFGASFQTRGIEVNNLRGIGNFGGKWDLLRKFIDDHHHRNTIVFVVLDNEGQAQKARSKLLGAASQYTADRKVTNDDYVHVWDRNVEFDNFSDEEIALALSIQSGRHSFSNEEIRAVRERFGSREIKGAGLQHLFSKRTGRDLNKPALLEALSDMLVKSVMESGEATPPRPIEKLLERIVKLASINHQPHALDIWERNQLSGYFGRVATRSDGDEGRGNLIVDG